MWIKRDFSDYIRRSVATRPAIVLVGARQTGKTSLLKNLFPQYNFVSLDLPADASEAENDPVSFLKKYPPPLIIDEIQYAPSIFRYLKKVIDERRNEKGLFILTGSQKFQLMESISESLAGRIEILELETLSFSEIKKSYPDMSVDRALLRGGHPELYQDLNLDAAQFYRSYVATYLERDVRAILNVGGLRDFDRFLRSCAFRTAQELNKSDLARDVGISSSTSGAWLSVLEASNQIVLLEPWFNNKSKSVVKRPKLYLNDVGILLFFLNIKTWNELVQSPYLGAIWETYVFSEMRKRMRHKEGGVNIYFWRDREKEIDFLIHRGGRFEVYECKWKESPTNQDALRLNQFEEIFGKNKIIKKRIICRTAKSFSLSDEVKVLGLQDQDADEFFL